MAQRPVSVIRAVPQLLQVRGGQGKMRPMLQQKYTITKITVTPVRHTFHYQSTPHTLDINNVVVMMHAGRGTVGVAEGAPFAPFDGSSIGVVMHELNGVQPLIEGQSLTIMELEAILVKHVRSPAARAAVEIAFFDLIANVHGVRVAELLNPEFKEEPLHTAITFLDREPAAIAHVANDAWARGFDRFKMKVGRGGLQLDIARVKAAHSAVPADQGDRHLRLLLDANGAYSADDAMALVQALSAEGIQIDIIEQPVPRDDLTALKQVRDVSGRRHVRVSADEAVFSLENARAVLGDSAVDVLTLKTMKHGGFLETLRIAQLANLYGVQIMIGCMVETGLGIRASFELAQALGNVDWTDFDSPLFLRSESADDLNRLVTFDGSRVTLGPSYQELHPRSGRFRPSWPGWLSWPRRSPKS